MAGRFSSLFGVAVSAVSAMAHAWVGGCDDSGSGHHEHRRGGRSAQLDRLVARYHFLPNRAQWRHVGYRDRFARRCSSSRRRPRALGSGNDDHGNEHRIDVVVWHRLGLDVRRERTAGDHDSSRSAVNICRSRRHDLRSHQRCEWNATRGLSGSRCNAAQRQRYWKRKERRSLFESS